MPVEMPWLCGKREVFYFLLLNKTEHCLWHYKDFWQHVFTKYLCLCSLLLPSLTPSQRRELNCFSQGFQCWEVISSRHERTSRRRPACAWPREGRREGVRETCGCESVIVNAQTMCRRAVVSAWVCPCDWACVGDYAIAAAVWRASPHTIKTLGFGRCLVLLKPGGSRLVPSFPRGSSICPFLVVSTASQLRGLQRRACVASFWQTRQGMRRIKAGQILGSIIHLFFLEKGSQTANPLLRVSSRPESAGLTHTSSGSLIAERKGEARIGYWLNFLGEC